ncbi:hypothetical protein HJB93_24960 [Rhizobium sp. NLR12b]|uniref:Rha family transcriptional regulator n=1 Tax=Rhizobium sp. NLR12b TaxID=2731108 RepID=UPI001C82FA2A|nr:Rha family transcriptional regulator [Rhizobium sp. NLR12b]MBX5302441.1 hypothetical protein [Rhizobium sp. NLR12b]
MAKSITLHMADGEPRIHDVELAAPLLFGGVKRLRDLIKRNSRALEIYGILHAVEKTSEVKGGRPAREFFLNRDQAIRIVMLADTITSVEVCAMVVTAFIEHARGESSAPPSTPDLAPMLSILQQIADTLALLTKHMAPH